jgi:AcrR family transcriptional regulator
MNDSAISYLKRIKPNRIARSYYDSAFVLASNNDVSDVTVQMVLENTGTSRQTFYNYFPDKNTFFNYVFFANVQKKCLNTGFRMVITEIIPGEIESNYSFYHSISLCTGTNSFSEFLAEYINYIITGMLSEDHNKQTVERPSFATTVDVYSNFISQHFIRWLSDQEYHNGTTSRDVGLMLYKNMPPLINQAFNESNPSTLDGIINETNIVNLEIGVLVGDGYVNDLIKAFYKKNSDLLVSLVKSGQYHSSRSFDIGLEISSFEFNDSNYEAYLLCTHGFDIWVPKKHPLAKNEKVTSEDLKNKVLIVSGFRERKVISRYMSDVFPDSITLVNESGWLLDNTMLDFKKGILIKSSFDKIPANSDIVAIPLFDNSGQPYKAGMYLYIPKDYPISLNERKLSQFIMEYSKRVDKSHLTPFSRMTRDMPLLRRRR